MAKHSPKRLALFARLAAFALASSVLAAPASAAITGSAKPADAKAIDVKVPDDFKAHQNADKNITIKAPPSWKETTLQGQVVINLLGEPKGVNVNVVVVGAQQGDDLEKIMQSLPDTVKKQFDAFKLESIDYIKVSGAVGGRIIYTATTQGIDLKFMQTVVPKGSKAYIITYTGLAKDYNTALDTVEQILASAEISE